MLKKTATIIDGKMLAEEILVDLRQKIAKLTRHPGLAVILIGDDPASMLYVKNKKKAAEKVGITFHDYFCDNEKCYLGKTETEILELIDWLNQDPEIDGIIVQLPLPKKFDTQKIINRLNPKKDVDGFHPQNLKNFKNFSDFPTSPLIAAIQTALLSTNQNLKNKSAVIVGKNPVFYQPLKNQLEKDGLKVTVIAHTEKNLPEKTKVADVLISIVGQPNFIKKEMVKPGAMVIDVGTNLIGKNQWVGDVENKVKEIAGFITPVPGGIGPLTVAMLLKNTFELAKNQQ